MEKDSLSISEKRFLFFKDIKQKSVTEALNEIIKISTLPQNIEKKVEMILCSTGGGCESAVAFYDTVVSILDVSLSVVATGEIDSSAVLMFLAAKAENRSITKNTTLYFHEVALTEGEEITMSDKRFTNLPREVQGFIAQTQEIIISIISERTKLKRKKVLRMMQKKKVINAEEAVKYGFACKIVSAC